MTDLYHSKDLVLDHTERLSNVEVKVEQVNHRLDKLELVTIKLTENINKMQASINRATWVFVGAIGLWALNEIGILETIKLLLRFK